MKEPEILLLYFDHAYILPAGAAANETEHLSAPVDNERITALESNVAQ
jgi:hypothetical protein